MYNQNNVVADLSTLTEDDFHLCLHSFCEYCKCIHSVGVFVEGYD